jgi:sugar-specific transcriptional regulator TrmB
LIARKTGLGRTHIYDIVEELKQKGLVSETKHRKIRQFVVEPPERLGSFLEEQKSQIETKQKALDLLMPTLTSLYRPTSFLPKVKLYEGEEGIRAIYDDTLKGSHKELLQLVSIKDILESPGKDYLDRYIRRRVKLGILVRSVVNLEGYLGDKKTGYNVGRTDLLRDVRYPRNKINLTAITMIYGNKVAMTTTKKEGFGFIVESEEFAHTMRIYFEALRANASPTVPPRYKHLV